MVKTATLPPTVDDITSQLAAWKLYLDPDIEYRLSSMFPKIKGWGVKAQIKQKVKLVNRVEPLLEEILLDGEEVLFVAKGVQYSFVEQYFMGLMAMFINQTVFVVTSARLLMFRSNTKGKPKQPHWQLYYSQVDEVKSKWNGVLHLKLRDGKKFTFTGFPKTDRRQMVTLFEQMVDKYDELGFDPEVSQSRENLCSHCHNAVPKDEIVCEHCGAEFWSPSALALRSLVIPAWGDWLMGHTFLAAWELLGVLFAWLVAFGLVMAAIDSGDPVPGFLMAAFVIGMSHGIDAIFTYVNAKKGLHARRGPDEARAAAARAANEEDDEAES